MPDFLITVGGILFVLLVLPVAVCLLLDRFVWHKPQSAEQAAAQRAELERRLAHPRPEEVAGRLGYPVPDALLAVYRDPALLTAPPFRVPGLDGYSAELTRFMPLEAQTLEETFYTGDHGFPFAHNFYGDPFFVPLDECRPGYCPVYHL